MQIRNRFLAALALTLSVCSLTVVGQNRSKKENHSSQVKTMFDILDKIDNATALSPAKAGLLLNVTLEPVLQESNQSIYIYKGHGGLWKEVELRLSPGGNGSSFVLVLHPAAPVSMKDVTAHFGGEYRLDLPDPSAGEQAMMGYSYGRAKGELRFSFLDLKDYFARIILFDRT